jgi:transcriptional regulator with XRE-family HTH domain
VRALTCTHILEATSSTTSTGRHRHSGVTLGARRGQVSLASLEWVAPELRRPVDYFIPEQRIEAPLTRAEAEQLIRG